SGCACVWRAEWAAQSRRGAVKTGRPPGRVANAVASRLAASPGPEESQMAIARKTTARWEGDLKNGQGSLSTPASGLMDNTAYGFNSRFGDARGTNPEELIAAAHAGCFTMYLSNVLAQAGHVPALLETRCEVDLSTEGGPSLSQKHLLARLRNIWQRSAPRPALPVCRNPYRPRPEYHRRAGGIFLQARARFSAGSRRGGRDRHQSAGGSAQWPA